MSLRIPNPVNASADWVAQHGWLSSSVATTALGVALLFWMPLVAATPVALLTGAYFGFAVSQDRLNRLRAQHDLDQVQIGRLRKRLADLEARPVAEASTKALFYIRDHGNGEGSERT
jgi:hypothetical protein